MVYVAGRRRVSYFVLTRGNDGFQAASWLHSIFACAWHCCCACCNWCCQAVYLTAVAIYPVDGNMAWSLLHVHVVTHCHTQAYAFKLSLTHSRSGIGYAASEVVQWPQTVHKQRMFRECMSVHNVSGGRRVWELGCEAARYWSHQAPEFSVCFFLGFR